MEMQEVRICTECGGGLKGRSDKVYCSDMCRTSANNRLVKERQSAIPECIARIQKALINNYKILERLQNKGSQLISKLYLLDLGFNFHYYTNIVENEKAHCYYCFNRGYALENDEVKLINASDLYD